MNIETVNELIQSLESAGELSIKERKYLDLGKAYVQLAAENVGLKAAFSPEEIPAEAVDAFMDTAVMEHDWNDTSEWSWVENETEVIRAVLDALKPETPATDRIYAGIKADGVDEFAESQKEYVRQNRNEMDQMLRAAYAGSAVDAERFAKQLREGADK
ncbi:TPA: hypothetical protein R2K56_003805 [Raoultella ornithinolytica]|nr:hypothetical protein [Raoultella ornithinolytica]